MRATKATIAKTTTTTITTMTTTTILFLQHWDMVQYDGIFFKINHRIFELLHKEKGILLIYIRWFP